MNLLSNAGDAIAELGTIRVRSWHEGDSVMVSVSDTGSGMSAATAEKIFEPFFTTKDVGKGTGLGLSISIGIIEEHKGRINVESTVGKGSTFTVSLPAMKPGSKEKDES